jgi:hypothetical protein
MSSSQVSLIYSTKTSVPYILKKSAPCIFNKKSAPYIFNRKKSILRLNFIFLHQKLYEKVTKVWWVERIFLSSLSYAKKSMQKNTWWTITSPCAKQKHTAKLNNDNGHFFANYTVHQRHSQCTHTHLYEYTHANPTPKSIFEDCVGKSSRLTKSPQTP